MVGIYKATNEFTYEIKRINFLEIFMKRILITLLLIIGFTQLTLTMEPEDNQNQIEEVREIQHERWLQQNAPAIPVAQPEKAEAPAPVVQPISQKELDQQLFAAVKNRKTVVDEVKRLLEMGANPSVCEYFDSALDYGIMHYNEPICRLLISHGANVNAIKDNDWNSLMVAANNFREPICQLLIEHGADLSFVNNRGRGALGVAASSGKRVCKFLIEQASFNPFISECILQNSRQRIFTMLLIFNRLGFSRDVRNSILLSPPLWKDTCNSAFGIHKGYHNRIPLMPLQVIRQLLQKGMLKPYETIKAIKAHNHKCLKPLMGQALANLLPHVSTETRDLLNPNNLETNFSTAIEQNIRRRLGLPETDDGDVVLNLQPQDEIGNQ